MTLIAATSNFGFPIIIGDILATSSEVANELVIPIFSRSVDKQLSYNKKYRPSKFVQKIYIISDTIVAGFAGSEYEIKLILTDLINFFKYKESTLLNLKNFIADVDNESFGASSAFLLCLDKETRLLHTLFINENKFRFLYNNTFENALAGGSGGKSFINILEKQRFVLPERTHSLPQAIVRNYIPLSTALTNEMIDLRTIEDGWGVGFEMIYLDDSKFVKMDNVTYLYWFGEVDLETGICKLSPSFIYNFKYFYDLLILSVFHLSPSTQLQPLTKYVVPPLYKRIEDIDIDSIPDIGKLDINNSRICNIFSFELSNGCIHSFGRFDVSGDILNLDPNLNRPIAGFEYMFPNGIYTPGVQMKFDYHEDGAINFNFTASPYYLEQVRKFTEKSIASDFNIPSFVLKLS